jgi:hypothetical protein
VPFNCSDFRPFKHLGEISSIRDDILHYGTEEDDSGDLFVSNAEKKHLPERATVRRVTVPDLIAMTYDLRDIEVHFAASMFRTATPPRPKMVALYTRRLAEPWLYKPPAPIPPQGVKRRDQAPKDPPQSSRGKRRK